MATIECRCKNCSNWGVNSYKLCRRKWRAIWFMIQRNGRVSEIEVKIEGSK